MRAILNKTVPKDVGKNTRFVKKRLGRVLVVQILLVNAVLSLFASSFQLYFSYQQDKSAILQTIDTIESGFRNSLEKALWEFNSPLVEALLEGIYTQSNVSYLRLTTDSDQNWTFGSAQAPDTLRETMVLVHENSAGTQTEVGKLSIDLSLATAKGRLWEQFLTLLFSNFVKTLVASGLMLWLFDLKVGRHLRRIANFLSNNAWLDTKANLSLDRRAPNSPDVLDQIVAACKMARQRTRDDFDSLRNSVERLRKAETQLKERSDALVEANREQAEFTYAISHELKAPANTVRMLIDELSYNEGKNLSRDGREILVDTKKTVIRMASLVEDVLAYSHAIGSARHRSSVALGDLMTGLKEDLRADLKAASAELITADLPVVKGDRTHLRILFQNLIENAVKFRTPDENLTITIDAETPDEGTAENMVTVRVKDNGIGIDPAYHDRIFELFQRLHSEETFGGSGVGLALCRRIVSNHGGSMEVSSEEGQGTVFKKTLPKA